VSDIARAILRNQACNFSRSEARIIKALSGISFLPRIDADEWLHRSHSAIGILLRPSQIEDLQSCQYGMFGENRAAIKDIRERVARWLDPLVQAGRYHIGLVTDCSKFRASLLRQPVFFASHTFVALFATTEDIDGLTINSTVVSSEQFRFGHTQHAALEDVFSQLPNVLYVDRPLMDEELKDLIGRGVHK
jgi:hypothetical protein